MMKPRLSPILLIVAAWAFPVAVPADAKELTWRELDVRARLETDGTLSVSERQAMLFTGDWNGGERTFHTRLGQSLHLDGIFRRDGAEDAEDWRALSPGSLDRVDQWDWSGRDVLRWRSRLPSDPEFDSTEIQYRIDYRITGVLARHGESWVLDHDFAFADRVGSIETFRLELDLAPEWSVSGATPPLRFAGGPLVPGVGQVVTLELRYGGQGLPALATARRAPTALRTAAPLVALLGVVALGFWALRRERAVGRFAALPPRDTVDRAWLREHVFSLPPEEIGAAWDRDVGAAEVAAMLARLQLEGKISSRVEGRRFLLAKPILHLELLVDRSRFDEAERKLIDGLFPAGDKTDTHLLRSHYRRSGFDPAGAIRAALLGRLGRRPGFAGSRARPSRRPSVVLLLAGVLGCGVAILLAPQDGGVVVALAGALVFFWLPAYAAAFRNRNRVVGIGASGAVMLVGLLGGLFAFARLAGLPGQSAISVLAGLALLLGLARTVATALQTREDQAAIARRRDLALARAWLAAELRRQQPDLADSATPYLIAFGLAPQIDRWFRAHGAASAVAARSTGSFGSGAGGGGGGGSWTGGGGAFGGAGATASWAMAATAMSAGVSAASSSSGGGGGGGSSGGGGGGGW
jgi:uncharacterized membrane protein YgcG